MPGLHLYTSNRLENLMEQLAVNLRDNQPPPMEKEIILVQNRGMQRWINLELARLNGICANIGYPFPRAYIHDLLSDSFDLTATPLLDKESMTWRIMKEMDSLLDKPEFLTLKNYVKDDTAGLKKYQLSEKIADVFDQYLISRPDLITEWEKGENLTHSEFSDSFWQQVLWNRISDTGSGKKKGEVLHHAGFRKKIMEEFGRGSFKTDFVLPERLSVFGISTLSPFYIDIFKRLAENTDIHFYYLNPCREYWEYAYSEKEILKFSRDGISEEDQYYDQGNPLLASMGTAGREFFSLLLESLEDQGRDLFSDPGERSMLSLLQSDILNLVNRNKDQSISVSPEDVSIQVHSCHSPAREIEVLHDNLLALFDGEHIHSPRDIVVMMPDVTTYAPLIRAVFDTPKSEAERIPYSIADTFMVSGSSVARTFLKLLNTGKTRYPSSDILDILETRAVRKQFNLTADDLELIKKWTAETGICWGIDGTYKKNLGLPSFHENSWRFGLERMLLGHALPPSYQDDIFSGILSYGEIEGDGARILGSFAAFMEMLFASVEVLKKEITTGEWAHCLNTILMDFFYEDEFTEHDISEIRDVFSENGLSGLSDISGFEETVSFDVILHYLNERIGQGDTGRGFISTGITFCTLLPMRSIPFKTVYLLGMNDGDYPRIYQRPGFDLMEKKRKLCDWSKRHEDRYLFLESILSARQNLIISYTGQSLKDNSELPPSVLVAELLDYLKIALKSCDGTNILDHLVTRHPLQPFSKKYFMSKNRLFSYSEENYRAAVKLPGKRKVQKNLIEKPLSEIVSNTSSLEDRIISLSNLLGFFFNPSEFILKNRLNISLSVSGSSTQETREPFELDFLQQYFIKNDLTSVLIDEKNKQNFFNALKLSGRLPHGNLATAELQMLEQEVLDFSKIVMPYLDGGKQEPLTGDLVFSDKSGVRITGTLQNLYSEGQLFFRCAKVKPRDLLRGWVHHLMLNALTDYEGKRQTRVLGTDRQVEFPELNRALAESCLSGLVRFFRKGIRFPLPFFPETSFAYAQQLLMKEKTDLEATSAAEKKWYTGYYNTGENENVYIQACFGRDFPKSDAFRQTAISLLEPVLENIMEIHDL